MFIIGRLFLALGNLLNFLINAYIILIIIHSIMSWINVPRNQFVVIIHSLVEPFLMKIREIIPIRLAGGIDFTPLIGILLLYFINDFLVKIIIDIGRSLI